MRISAMIDRGHWANQIRKLASVMGQTVEEIVRQQAALVARDCVKLTPPIGPGYRPLTEGFPVQLKAGRDAIAADIQKVYRSADTFSGFSQGETVGKFAKAAAGLAKAGRWERLQGLTKSGSLQRMLGLVNRVDATFYDAKRLPSTGRPGKQFRGYFLHTGTIPRYRAPGAVDGKLTTYGGINRLAQQKVRQIGIAKSGWVSSMDALGGKRSWAPRWVRRHAAKTSGSAVLQLTKGLKASVTVGNGVPYIQETGSSLRIVQNAMKHRRRNIEKQIEQAIRAQRRAKSIGIK
jgi:hypothetical protein